MIVIVCVNTKTIRASVYEKNNSLRWNHLPTDLCIFYLLQGLKPPREQYSKYNQQMKLVFILDLRFGAGYLFYLQVKLHNTYKLDKVHIDRQLSTNFWSHEMAYKLDVVIQFLCLLKRLVTKMRPIFQQTSFTIHLKYTHLYYEFRIHVR